MGVAVRSGDGEMKLLTGNQIGSLLAYYRAKKLFEQGVLNSENASRGVIIKTFVTTDLQKAIAEKFGLRCVETLTGFKYIGAKLEKYERAVPPDADRELSRSARRRKPAGCGLEHSAFYIFGGEESYGYSGADFVRDKDGNGAAIMFCEVAAYAKSLGLTIDGLLDQVYCEIGYYLEKNGALTFEGAEGAAKIQRLLATYVSNPPNEMLGSKVIGVQNFETDIDPRCRGRQDSARENADLRTGGPDTDGGARLRARSQRSNITSSRSAARMARGSRSDGAGRDQDARLRRESWKALWGRGCRQMPRSRIALCLDRIQSAPTAYANFPAAARHPARRGHNFLVSEINLNGGEITILKTLGLSGALDGGRAIGRSNGRHGRCGISRYPRRA